MGMSSLSLLESHIRECRKTADPATLPEICIDSRQVKPGSIFVALPPSEEGKLGGAAFIADAMTNGAKYVVCKPEDSTVCLKNQVEIVDCADPRKALGLLAQARYGTDALSFPLVGVTGTNGKTTCTYLLSHLMHSAGRKTGVIGTIAYLWPGHRELAPMTTPDCLQMHSMLESMQKENVDVVCMEVSSHALDQDRLAGMTFSGAIFTNLTQDHLDYHKDMAHYFQAKAKLFQQYCSASAVRVIGTDNIWGQKLFSLFPNAIGYGLTAQKNRNFLFGEILSNSTNGLHLRMTYEGKSWELKTPLIGRFNAENLLAVQALGLGFGLTDFQAFETFNGVSGRLERIPDPAGGRHIFVDYAHTPDALLNVLATLKDVGFQRIVTVFGCGGDRDRTKRPLMGEAVAQYSDVAVLTSDNPRHEDPQAIMNDVMPGLKKSKHLVCEPDRHKALGMALELLKPGDALLVAGKGHEQTQQIGDIKHPFSDQSILKEMLGCA